MLPCPWRHDKDQAALAALLAFLEGDAYSPRPSAARCRAEQALSCASRTAYRKPEAASDLQSKIPRP